MLSVCIKNMRNQGFSRVRVGILSHDLRLGGAERWIVSLAKYFDRSRIDMVGVALIDPVLYDADLMKELASVTTVSAFYDPMTDNLKRAAGCITQAKADRFDVATDLAERCDVLITWGSGQNLQYVKGGDAKVVLVSHTARSFPNLTLQGVDYLVGCSFSSLLPFLETRFSAVPSSVIYNGSDTARIKPVNGRDWQRRQWGLAPSDIAVGFLSRQSIEKNYTLLADAVQTMPSHYHAIYYGQDQERPGTFSPELIGRERVHLHLPVANLGDVFAGLDVLALPTRHEAYSLTVIESWLAGVPVICTPIGNEPEVAMTHGSLTTVIPFDATADELAAAIVKARGEPSLAKAQKAKKIAWEQFTCEAMAANWADFLESIAGEKSSGNHSLASAASRFSMQERPFAAYPDRPKSDTALQDGTSLMQAEKRLKVSFLSHDLALGGAERWIVSMAKHLKGNRIDVTMLGLTDPRNYDRSLLEEASQYMEIVACDVPGRTDLSRAEGCISRRVSSPQDVATHLAETSDVVITWGSGELSRFIRSGRATIVLASHTTQSFPTLTLEGTDVLVGCCLAALRPFFDLSSNPVLSTVIYNGIDPSRVTPMHGREWQRSQWNLAPSDIAVGFVGRQSSEKNHTLLADAIERMPSCYHAVYYGQSRGDPGAFAKELMGRDRVHLHAAQPHLGDVYAGLDVLVAPSRFEAFSLTILEAWLAGVPVVCTPIGNESETVLKFGSLCTVVPLDCTPEELALAIQKARGPAALLKATKAKEVASEHFTVSTMVKNWENFLLSIQEQKSKRSF